MKRYICIHGHFYQPPRENAWLEQIEQQDSAYPYHDWNERVTVECYAPNSAARILDDNGFITKIVSNYDKISFDFGPTLLAWMADNRPDIYQSVLTADRGSLQRFSGHGSAIAQCYSHMIMPLANRRDKFSQVYWGIKDFERRFGRYPEGMWLPETAVDLETLDIMAELGIKYTILAQRQASRTRSLGEDNWLDARGSQINTSRTYRLNLASGRNISLFFYNEAVSHEVAFNGLLSSGERFANSMINAFSGNDNEPQLVHIATDGETYGHHHQHGDMALAFALDYIMTKGIAKVTNYGEYLAENPPQHEVEIIENTSWSCIHGIERWRTGCGCHTGGDKNWNQAWRKPLRESLDWLRDNLISIYEEKAKQLFSDVWMSRNDYIDVILDRSSDNIDKFLSEHANHQLDAAARIRALKLLEMQRFAMLMYTSCGWFFNELSGLETVQVIQYAGRVIQLATELTGSDFETGFLSRLKQAKSNLRRHGDGHQIYLKWVKPAMITLTDVGAHYAISSLFEEYEDNNRVFCYSVDSEDHRSEECGKARMAVGKASITSIITLETKMITYGVLHFGDHNIHAGIRDFQGDEQYQAMVKEITEVFTSTDFPEIIRLFNHYLGMSTYSLKSLFRDEQRKVLNKILETTMQGIELAYHGIYEANYPIMHFMADIDYTLPKSLKFTADFINNLNLRELLSDETIDVEKIKSALSEADGWNIEIDSNGLGYLLQRSIEEKLDLLVANPTNIELMREVAKRVSLVQTAEFAVNLWEIQNKYDAILQNTYPQQKMKGQQGDQQAKEWLSLFGTLGEQLSIKVT